MKNKTASPSVVTIVLNKTQTAFLEKAGCNAVGLVSGTVKEIGEVMKAAGCEGCEIVFSTMYAPNFKRCFNSFVKRAKRIAEVAGVSTTEPKEYYIQGYRQTEKWVITVL